MGVPLGVLAQHGELKSLIAGGGRKGWAANAAELWQGQKHFPVGATSVESGKSFGLSTHASIADQFLGMSPSVT